jgi:hypothetical protein
MVHVGSWVFARVRKNKLDPKYGQGPSKEAKFMRRAETSTISIPVSARFAFALIAFVWRGGARFRSFETVDWPLF